MRIRPTIVRLSPPVEEIDLAASELAGALDGLVSALALIAPDVGRWPAPDGALRAIMKDDLEVKRSEHRLREVLNRVEIMAGEDYGEDITEALRDAKDLAMAAAASGWRLGLATARASMTTATAASA
jgi:phosphoglycolate phosphatase-like HAD superfamily hydrolase